MSESLLLIFIKINGYLFFYIENSFFDFTWFFIYSQKILSFFFWMISDTIPYNSTLFFFMKFFLILSFLIFIRTGIPRYRYDFLTKLGWIKFLVVNLSFFSLIILGYLLW